MAAGLQLWLRPRLSGRFLAWHGALLGLMAPFGFHWLPQGAALRTMSGVWFGAAVMTFLRLALPNKPDKTARATEPGHATRLYWCGLLAALLGIPAAASWGGIGVAYSLTGLAAIGGAVFAGLAIVVAADLGKGLLGQLEKA